MKLRLLLSLAALSLSLGSAYAACSSEYLTWHPQVKAAGFTSRSNSTVEPDMELYRIAAREYFTDLILRYGDDPCETLHSYCRSQQRGGSSQRRCVDKLYPELLREILRFSDDMKRLNADMGLFMNCRSDITPNLKASFNSSDSQLSQSLNQWKEELLQILSTTRTGEKLNDAIKLFDIRRNEVKMTPLHKLHLYQEALFIQPNSTYVINQLGLALSSVGENDLAITLYRNAVERGLWPHVLQRPEFTFITGLTSKPWHNNQDFQFIAKLEKGYKIIRDELMFNLEERRHIFNGEQENHNIFSGGDWKALQIKSMPGLNSGYTKYAQYFPKTVSILKECNEDFLLIKFSAINPGTHIEPHTGPSNERLRTHLTLIHTGGARIRVGSEWRTWKEGKAIILDSSWEHEVIHEGNDARIILILDIWHPDYKIF